MPSDSYADRERAESFGSVAQQYDRFRPSYPPALIDDLVALRPAGVLDVGCGTGKAAVLLAGRGLSVLGVEVDGRMAEVARGHGIPVEVSAFESWDAAGRVFDLLTCAQAWHWIDPEAGAAKAAALLRPGGTLALFWNYDDLEPGTRDALQDVYRRLAPELAQSVVVGGGRQNERPHVEELQASGHFASIEKRTYRWEIARTVDEWLATTATHSDHLRLEPALREQVMAELADVLGSLGDAVVSRYVTYTAFARVP